MKEDTRVTVGEARCGNDILIREIGNTGVPERRRRSNCLAGGSRVSRIGNVSVHLSMPPAETRKKKKNANPRGGGNRISNSRACLSRRRLTFFDAN